jgi:hypothetical protein
MCSATGRGTTRDEKDFYCTPDAAFKPLLSVLPIDADFYEPCAGDGRLIRWLRESGRNCDGSDLYPPHEFGGLYDPRPMDYLKDTRYRDFVITNPPFTLAFEMCKHARQFSREFMFLLRLSFLESDDRGDWLTENEPGALFVLRKRPSFVMSITCKSGTSVHAYVPCKHNWMLPIESPRPKVCPKCGGDKLSISTSDNSGYAWFYWGKRFVGIHHI